jgi:hypothetical protein
MNDEKPRADDIVATGVNFGIITNRMPKIAQTRTMMGFVQWNRPSGLVIRTGAGFGGHAYAYYYPYPPDPFGAESIEWGLAFSFAAGKEWRRATRVGVSVEGFVTYSTGEDSTSPRVVTGVQVSPLLRIF